MESQFLPRLELFISIKGALIQRYTCKFVQFHLWAYTAAQTS